MHVNVQYCWNNPIFERPRRSELGRLQDVHNVVRANIMSFLDSDEDGGEHVVYFGNALCRRRRRTVVNALRFLWLREFSRRTQHIRRPHEVEKKKFETILARRGGF